MIKAKKISFKSKQLRQPLMLVFGIITGLFVLCSSGLQFQISDKIENDLRPVNEQSDEQQGQETTVQAFDALSQTVNVQVITPFLLSFGYLPDHEEQEQAELPYVATGINRYFKTLFRLIISPNAP